MYEIYENWPNIAEENYKSDLEELDHPKINHIVFSGMGGSGTIGDVISSIMSKTNIHVEVIKGYTLPKTITKNSLVVTSSVSGNTEETLSTLKNAKKLNCKIVAFSSGGKMEKYAIKNNIDFRKIPKIHSPRASFPAFLYSILKVLRNTVTIKNKEIEESIKQLKKSQKNISINNLDQSNQSLTIAEFVNDIPIIYYPFGLKSAAIRFKNSLQENAKMHAITEDIIESSHNGIVSWEKTSQIKPIMIQGSNDHVKTVQRWNILKEYFKTKDIDYIEIHSMSGNILTKIINLIYVLDYSTIYRSILSKTDPSPVDAIDFIKKRLE